MNYFIKKNSKNSRDTVIVQVWRVGKQTLFHLKEKLPQLLESLWLETSQVDPHCIFLLSANVTIDSVIEVVRRGGWM